MAVQPPCVPLGDSNGRGDGDGPDPGLEALRGRTGMMKYHPAALARSGPLAAERPTMPQGRITELLKAVRDGESTAADELLRIVYAELKAMARARLAPAGRRPITLDSGALVHEAYVKLFDRAPMSWQDRRHFFSVAAIAMRQIIVDHARRAASAKRGGAVRPLQLDTDVVAVDEQSEQIVALDEALRQLARLDDRLATVVELRFFVGLNNKEIAQALAVNERTITRDWVKALFLLRQYYGVPV